MGLHGAVQSRTKVMAPPLARAAAARQTASIFSSTRSLYLRPPIETASIAKRPPIMQNIISPMEAESSKSSVRTMPREGWKTKRPTRKPTSMKTCPQPSGAYERTSCPTSLLKAAQSPSRMLSQAGRGPSLHCRRPQGPQPALSCSMARHTPPSGNVGRDEYSAPMSLSGEQLVAKGRRAHGGRTRLGCM